jgi:hypothetical protein
MKTSRSVAMVVVALGMVLAGLSAGRYAAAQPRSGCRGGGGWGPGAAYGRLYDPKTVETVSGEVIGIDALTPMGPMCSSVHVQLKTSNETISIHLGPAWYIDNQDTKIEAKDKVEVKGSRVSFNGKPAIIAAEVKKGDAVRKLRDENGIPVWAGWRRR